MKYYIFFLLLGGTFHSLAQYKWVDVCTKKADITIPFYEIQNMSCTQGKQASVLDKMSLNNLSNYQAKILQDNLSNSFFTLNNNDLFSLIDGEVIYEKPTTHNSLFDSFKVSMQVKRTHDRSSTTNFMVLLTDKNTRLKQILKVIQEELRDKFPKDDLQVVPHITSGKYVYGKESIRISVRSYAKKDEFETTQSQKKRFQTIGLELERLITKHITTRIQKIRKEVILPYQKALKSKFNVSFLKIHTLKFDIKSIGSYDADKGQFSWVSCMDETILDRLGAPVEQAKILRANPTDYQIRAYVFNIHKSYPWSPDMDLNAFDFFEVVHKDSEKLLLRTFAHFVSRKRHYRYQLYFPFPR